MSPEFAISLGRQAIETVLMLSAPLLLAGMLVGLLVSVFQAATQINEQTMTFIPKIVAVFVTLLICSPWMIRVLVSFTRDIFNQIPTLGG
ncbi:MAG: flagellar biosynthesis protein FliQ [Syntrophotalea acetylenica]|jgi:flagellar biosynthetic protein FliQ|uniref:Flagellar biosynthetic protein FliQ n=1 Tax=Syntrophotalea acetylenica TaxID=29542 RepID=A0A1L3GCU9_SYNAC|nr:flagellar biosynthesis protein FliQ [Syntrophotalea acetylenica]APG23770.1 EscS/YscS/HrcS family type III secretion system export apparatus protein [Syntrophotalea acetylenica]APG44351.1 EscS/YscS/HrcS family type III secretion system export apparatus protein [Syntrophotalea acetylenica]MDD4457067.1 flagellar biosynthesis protein FliQ [Syntrophotalea acetylenica]MDY0261525.1 flagellar biosynthesis protein FliQ [Syntrophotalea acetylenica]